MFFTRLASGILLVVLALVFILTGGPIFAALLCMISIAAYRELGKAVGFITEDKTKRALEYTGMILTVVYYVWIYFAMLYLPRILYSASGGNRIVPVETIMYRGLTIGIIFTFVAYLFVYVFRFPNYHAKEVMMSYFSFLYGPVMLSLLYLIREGFSYGKYFIWLVFLCSWGSDTCAYAVGVLFGKHKMTPKLSPKKSVEGAIGGIVGAALLFVLYKFLLERYGGIRFDINIVIVMVFGALGAFVSMIGDLAASAIKRDYDIKDYGKLIPGHGGIMDRFDSVIIAAPIIFAGLTLNLL